MALMSINMWDSPANVHTLVMKAQLLWEIALYCVLQYAQLLCTASHIVVANAVSCHKIIYLASLQGFRDITSTALTCPLTRKVCKLLFIEGHCKVIKGGSGSHSREGICKVMLLININFCVCFCRHSKREWWSSTQTVLNKKRRRLWAV